MATLPAIELLAAQRPDLEPEIPLLSGLLANEDRESWRHGAGAFYTPGKLVEAIVSEILTPWLHTHPDSTPTIVDPSCGTGRFLLEAGRRLVERQPGDAVAAWRRIGPSLRGWDTDPHAIAWTRGRLITLAGGDPAAAAGITCGDAISPSALPRTRADLILGNPPFGTPLKSSGAESLRRRAADLLHLQLPPYIDQAAIFLLMSARSLRPDGRLGMVQPLSFLSARDAQLIRRELTQHATLDFVWSTQERLYDAQVHTCVIGLTGGTSTRRSRRLHDLPPIESPSCPTPSADSWAPMAAPALGLPDLPPLRCSEMLGTIATATADFRDQYYGLKPAIEDCGGTMPQGAAALITSGLLDPAHCRWSVAPVRIFKQSWAAPVIRLGNLSEEMRRWAESRLQPKVLLPTQTRVLEPVLDEHGRWLPSVPVITIRTSNADDLPLVAALLASPIAAIIAMHRHLGAARSPQAIKVSASNVMNLPTPDNVAAWRQGGTSFVDAQNASNSDDRIKALTACARSIHAAFGIGDAASDALVTWWRERLPKR